MEKTFNAFKNLAREYKGNAKTIEELYEECAKTTTWSWQEIKAYKMDRPTNRQRRKIQEEREVFIKGNKRKNIPDKTELQLVDVCQEYKPDRNYDNIIAARLFIEFEAYIRAMANRYRKSIDKEDVIFIAEDTFVYALDYYDPTKVNVSNGKTYKTSFKQTYNTFFTNHLKGACQSSSYLMRTGRTKQYDPNSEEDDTQILTNSLDAMVENGGVGLPSIEDDTLETMNLKDSIRLILASLPTKGTLKKRVTNLFDSALKGEPIKRKDDKAILQKLIIENKDLFFNKDLITKLQTI